ncbi:MAG: divalent metal cation transporter [Thermoproteus sp.]
MDLKKALELFGPAWIAMMADVDAASVITAVATGETYGYGLIWLLLLLIVPLFLIQNVAGRVGIAGRGRGLGELIREFFGPKWALVAALPMFLVDMFSYAVEFTGISVGALLIGLPRAPVLLAVYFFAIFAVVGRHYKEAERYILPVTLLVPLAFVAEAAIRGYDPSPFFYISTNREFLFFLAANIGAVVMPFMIFYQVSATSAKYVEAGGDVKAKASWVAKETLIGAFASQAVMIAIVAASTGMDGADPLSPSSLSRALIHVAGSYSPYLFGFGLIAASLLAYIAIALASSWGAVDAFGVKNRASRDVVYALEPLPALAALLLVPGSAVTSLALELMAVSPLVLLIPGALLGLLARNRSLMGELTCSRKYCLAYWAVLGVLAVAGAVALIY